MAPRIYIYVLTPGSCEYSLIAKRVNSVLYDRSVIKDLDLLFSHSAVSDSLWPQGLEHVHLLCPSLSPRVCSESCPLSQWCYLTISSSATRFSFYLQSFPASESFPVSWLCTSGGQTIGASASASVLPMNIQGWFPLGLTGFISLLSKGISRVFSSITVQTINFGAQLLCGPTLTSTHDYWKNHSFD